VIAGEIISSMAYNKEKEGTAMTNNIIAGVTVQITSINVP
jgi:hypothetical protein